MKVAIIGTRGLPAKYGGFETFAQEVSERLAEKDIEVTVVCPNSETMHSSLGNVKLIYTKSNKDDTPMKYYFESVYLAVKGSFDIVLMCGQGGYAYLPHLWKKKTEKPVFITNTDGIEHRRTKWNKFVRLGVRVVGELTSVLFSDVLVADSKGIRDYLKKEYRFIPSKKIFTIEYGAEALSPDDYPVSLLSDLNLASGGYHLVVARLEPENNVSMIIDGYNLAKTEKELIVVGNIKDNDFVRSLQERAKGRNIRFIGGVYDPLKLKALRIHCASYLHGHSVGGTNPSLLEALGAGNIVIGHDNPFNREVTDNKMFYFSDAEECAKAIEAVDELSDEKRSEYRNIGTQRIIEYYNWDRIADEYLKMFNEFKGK